MEKFTTLKAKCIYLLIYYVRYCFEGYEWHRSQWGSTAAVSAQRSQCDGNPVPSLKRHSCCKSVARRRQSNTSLPQNSRKKTNSSQNVSEKKVANLRKSVNKQPIQSNISQSRSDAKDRTRSQTVKRQNPVHVSSQPLSKTSRKPVKKRRTTNSQKSDGLKLRADNQDWSSGKKSGKQTKNVQKKEIQTKNVQTKGKLTKNVQTKVVRSRQSGSAISESQQREDLLEITAVRAKDDKADVLQESRANKKRSTGKKDAWNRIAELHLVQHRTVKCKNKDKYRITCPTCSLMFLSNRLLNQHLVCVHSDDDRSLWPYPCRFCSKRLLTAAQQRSHEKEVHTEEYLAYLCQTCGKRFGNESGLQQHLLLVHTPSQKQQFACDVCDKRYCHASRLERHRRCHNSERLLGCPFCQKRFHVSSHLYVHVLQHLGVQPHACPVCSRTFCQKSNLGKHMQYHHPQVLPTKTSEKNDPGEHCNKSSTVPSNWYSDVIQKKDGCGAVQHHCDQCDKQFTDYIDLKRHRSVAHPDKTLTYYACTVCGGRFPRFTDLDQHRKDANHGAEMCYICDVCEDRFPTGFRLRVHRFRHFRERPFVCRRCGRHFYSQRRINSHVLQHANVEKYQCLKCEKAYYNPHLLRLHMLQHVVSDPVELTNHRDRMRAENIQAKSAPSERRWLFICSDCGCHFRNSRALRIHFQGQHMLQYGCEECGKYFSTLTNVRRHQLIHSGTRKYCCELCGRQFTQSNTLKEHLRTHTGVRPFVCSVCGHGYTQSSNLKAHMRKHLSP